eukprot:TRINITY_DN59999_c1_g2_i1.p1 TRINITY_DN59999_c1_g2~~TRINITY_DN59999_c1_g2_i1.p1  ORF type:complete len:371 (-),score=29.97 TRINITY_DN59999_c1_g2_i1:38-1084(-)
MDKTGTLTKGHFGVVSSVGLQEGYDSEQMITAVRYAAAIESKSAHPLAMAVLDYLGELKGDSCLYSNVQRLGMNLDLPKATDINLIPGQGVTGIVEGKCVGVGNLAMLESLGIEEPEKTKKFVTNWMNAGQTVVFITIDDKAEVALGFLDSAREVAQPTVSELIRIGVTPTLLTGDSTETALAIQKHVGVQGFQASMLPEDKLQWIKEKQDAKKVVGMIGDGINDGPALAQADVGIAMGAGGTALACEAANVVLMHDKLELVPALIQQGRHARNLILMNICMSVVIKLFALGFGMAGLVPLWGAILVDLGSLILVLANGLRALHGLKSVATDPPPMASIKVEKAGKGV